MRALLDVEKAIERKKIAAYVVSHLPIVKAYAVKISTVISSLEFLSHNSITH